MPYLDLEGSGRSTNVQWVRLYAKDTAKTLAKKFRDQLPNVVLIDPMCSRRRSRWTTIIEWYLKRVELEKLRAKRCFDESCHVVSIGEASAPPAKFFATIQRANFAHYPNIRTAVDCDLGGAADCNTILFAPRDVLTSSALSQVRKARREGVSIVTGYDPAAMHFMAVKIVLSSLWPTSHAVPNPILLIDELSGCVSRRDSYHRVAERCDFTADRVTDILDQDHDLLLLHVHGEGAHANLRETVLCGAAIGPEKVREILIPGGCGFSCAEHGRYCKRACDPNINVRGFEELRAREVALFSCNGLSVSDELYPSTTSCALALIDGYAAGFLCNDRTVPLSSADVDAMHALIANHNASLGDVVDLMNSVAEFRSNCRPWFLMGAPSSNRLSWADDSVDDVFSADSRIALLTLPLELRASDLGLKLDSSAPNKSHVLRGADRLALILDDTPDRKPSNRRCRLVSSDSDVSSDRRWLIAGHAALLSSSALEHGLDRVYGDTAEKGSSLYVGFDRLHKLRLLVEQSINKLAYEHSLAMERGWLDERIALYRANCRALMSAWDQTFANLAAGPLAAGGLEACFRDGYVSRRRRPGRKCARCGGRLLNEEMEALSRTGERRLWTFCTICGPQSYHEIEGLNFELFAPVETMPGTTIAVSFKLNDPSPTLSCLPAFVGINLRDKGKGRTLATSCTPIKGDVPGSEKAAMTNLVVPVPTDASPDLHTLRLTIVRGLRVAHRRVRIACVPRA